MVFGGISEGACRRIVFVEVKTGKRPILTPKERSIREAVESKRVEYVVLWLPRKVHDVRTRGVVS